MSSEKSCTVVWTGQSENWQEKLNRIFRTILLGPVQFYRVYLSSWLGGNCRFYPSCSEYAVEALNTQSPGRACRLIFHRLCKCHPFGESGYDPVPCNERTK